MFLVAADGERHLVVKAGAGVAREAAVIERLRPVATLTHALPRVVAHDRAEQVLVLEAAPGARDLVRHHARGRFSRSLAAEAGRRSHACTRSHPRRSAGSLRSRPPRRRTARTSAGCGR